MVLLVTRGEPSCLRKDSGCPFGVHQSSVLESIRALCQRAMGVLFESIRALCLIKDGGCLFGVHQSSVSDKGQWMSFWSPSELCARERTMDVLLEFIRALCQSPSELYARVHQSSVPESSGCPLGVHQSSVPEKRQWTSFLSPSELCV